MRRSNITTVTPEPTTLVAFLFECAHNFLNCRDEVNMPEASWLRNLQLLKAFTGWWR
jgi:hypothetical protein